MRYDHIVVGGGTAGCILAAKLSEDPARSVLLLEAGPEYPDFEQLPDVLKYGWGLINLQARAAGSPFNWSFTGTATPQQSQPMPVPRGKVLGGSSAINGQTFIRGAPEDFDTWASLGNDEWSYLKVCLTSAGSRMTRSSGTISTAPKALSQCAVTSVRTGRPCRRLSIKPASRPATPTTQTCTTQTPPG